MGGGEWSRRAAADRSRCRGRNGVRARNRVRARVRVRVGVRVWQREAARAAHLGGLRVRARARVRVTCASRKATTAGGVAHRSSFKEIILDAYMRTCQPYNGR